MMSGYHQRTILDIVKVQIASIIKSLLSASMRFKIRSAVAWLRDQFDRARIWRWECVTLSRHQGSPYDFFYLGRKSRRELALKLLEVGNHISANEAGENSSSEIIYISEAPFFGALQMPSYLHAIVPLGRSLDEITASYGESLRRLIRNKKAQYRIQQTRDITEINRAEQDMLRPYAINRHGEGAAQLTKDEVQRIALKNGRLDLVYSGDQIVACHLGYEFSRNNKRYWATLRFGYPESVFTDPKRLKEINAINSHLELEWAIQNGYDYYDIGGCSGRPEDGLLQWKKRRGGVVDLMGNHAHFYVKLPQKGAAKFLWNSPIFSVKRSKLALHLGLPEGTSDEDFATRYCQIGFGGLSTVYLHCERYPGEDTLRRFNRLFVHQALPSPNIEVIQSISG
jgi:hypothetical protein